MGDVEWGKARLERLRDLWAEGHSTAEIGRLMGISKNAVVGKAHRLNLPARPSPIRRGETPATPNPPRAPRRTLAIAAPPERAPPAAPRRTVKPCCWPLWGAKEKPTHRYCGADQVLGAWAPYCAEHLAKARRNAVVEAVA